jgi:hypothetical protein
MHHVLVYLPEQTHTMGKRDKISSVDIDPLVIDFPAAPNLLGQILIRQGSRVGFCHRCAQSPGHGVG